MSSLTNFTIPQSWKLVSLKELGVWSGGGTPSKSKPQYWQKGTVPWVSPKDMKTERISDSEDHITKEAVSQSATSLIMANSVLVVTRSGILRHTLPVAVNTVPVTVNQDLKALTPQSGILAEYVAWALRALSRNILNTCSKQGTTVHSIETAKLLSFKIPLAPIEQQKSIVAEIEKQFSRLDEAVASLKRTKANLKRYKAAVLKAPVEGKLTEDWRKQHPNVEPASKLLERILAERRAKWNGKGQYKEPVEASVSNLPSLPHGWAWATVAQLTPADRPCAYGVLQPGEHIETGVPIVRVGDIDDGMVNQSELKRISPKIAARYPRTRLQGGEVVISLVGAIGRTAVIPNTLRGANTARAVGVIPLTSNINPRWVEVWFRSPSKIAEMTAKAHEVARKTLNLEDVRDAAVALPPPEEQQAIVNEVERRLSVIEELEAAVGANLSRGERLRQAILQLAFSGNLVNTGA